MAALSPALTTTLANALGAPVHDAAPVSGGDINNAFRLTLNDGRAVFLKTPRSACPGMYAAEAAGLEFLRESASELRIPKILSVSDEGATSHLALEHLAAAAADRAHDEGLGAGLAAMHGHSLPALGHLSDNFIATLPQDNAPCSDWPTFYAERRLRPMLERACRRGAASRGLRLDVEKLLDRLPELLATDESPCPVHGDLWGGNAMASKQGPAIFDPAAYAGHREVDLAMMHLFGGFSTRVFEAYEIHYPLSPGHAERRPLYQLYPVLVHVNLFGGYYADQARRLVQRYL